LPVPRSLTPQRGSCCCNTDRYCSLQVIYFVKMRDLYKEISPARIRFARGGANRLPIPPLPCRPAAVATQKPHLRRSVLYTIQLVLLTSSHSFSTRVLCGSVNAISKVRYFIAHAMNSLTRRMIAVLLIYKCPIRFII